MPLLHAVARREGLVVNHKRTERVYRELGLSLRLRRRKTRPSHLRVLMPRPAGPDEPAARRPENAPAVGVLIGR